MPATSNEITGIILAGGRATRMGGVDKGLVRLRGRTLIEHVIDSIRPQVVEVIINANRNLDIYRRLGFKVVTDKDQDFSGPLAGMLSGLEACASTLALTTPCDTPLIGSNIARRLNQALNDSKASIAVAHDGERLHPVVSLLKTELADSIDRFLGQGERKIDKWFALHHWISVDFSDHPEYFLNINTEGERLRLEQHHTS